MTHTPRASPSVPAHGVTLVVMPMFLGSYRYLVMGSSSELHYFSSTSGHIWHVSLLGLRTILLAKDDAKSSFSLWSFFLVIVTTPEVTAARLLRLESVEVAQAWSARLIQFPKGHP